MPNNIPVGHNMMRIEVDSPVMLNVHLQVFAHYFLKSGLHSRTLKSLYHI
jgi:hypothetical protein